MDEADSLTVDDYPRPPSALGSAQSSPVGVVWCRQVDNEAESPGYTTIPEDFPGHGETIDAIRIVGNLTVNIADTHDYWDPDPTQPLSYYPNLFLYPAFGGRYTCVGRMFLSTEDRPRLGMKTLVLDTHQLLATGEFGPTILRWHSSMGGARPPGSRPPPVPDPRLFGLLGEGFLFHRGATDSVLVIASDDWDASMQVILEMVRVLPASLVALGAILAFPYFLPQPKTNIHELTEQIPLSLALMRIARREAVGERHAQRIAAWEKTPLTVRDLTQDWTGSGSRGKESLPLVLQYVRDRTAPKLGPIVQRVDIVESGRHAEELFEPEHQSGRDRRKEMWRIGTAMESAALLLQRARGRHVPVNVETAKRAQQYLQARLPSNEGGNGEAAFVDNTISASEPEPRTAEPTVPGQLPPWLQRTSEPAQVVRTERVEVVPVSLSDDPSFHPPQSREALSTGAMSESPTTEPPAPNVPSNQPSHTTVSAVESPTPDPMIRVATPLPFDLVALRADIEKDLLRYVEQRIPPGATPGIPAPPQNLATDEKLHEVEQRLSERIDEALTRLETQRSSAGTALLSVESIRAALEERMMELAEAQNRAIGMIAQELTRRGEDAGNRQRLNTLQEIAAAETRLRDALTPAVAEEIHKKLSSAVDPRLAEMDRRLHEATHPEERELDPRLRQELGRSIDALRSQLTEKEEELRTGLFEQMELHAREVTEQEKTVQDSLVAAVPAIVEGQLKDQEIKVQRIVRESEARVQAGLDGRNRDAQEHVSQAIKELQDRVGGLIDSKLSTNEAKLTTMTDARVQEMQEANRQAVADLQVRMEGHFDQRLREAQEVEREKYLELLARLKSDFDQSLAHLFETPKFEGTVRERLTQGFDQLRADSQKLLETRLGAAETRIRADQSEGIRRLGELEKALEGRGKELFRVEETIRSDLDEMDRRIQVLTDRLVPIVRKTWVRIGEVEKVRFPLEDPQAKLDQFRREYLREIRRLQQEIAERTADIRDRMEATLANQGKVWLAVIRQMSQNAVDRSSPPRSRASDDQFALEGLPTTGAPAPPDEEIPNIFDPRGDSRDLPDAEANRSSRRRSRRSDSSEGP